MAGAGAEEVVHVWREWGIPALVLLSFALQVTLLILAMFRRHVDSAVPRFFIWSAYMMADSTAIYVLGHMAVARSGRSSSPERRALTAFWVPFLLVHLGGQDNITAYAIEDNRLWLRHLQTLVVQVAAATYVLYESSSSSSILGNTSSSSRRGSSSLLRWATILMFAIGIVKYGERVWALWCTGRRSTRGGGNDNYRSMERTKKRVDVDDIIMKYGNDYELLFGMAHNMLEIAKGVVWEGATTLFQGPFLGRNNYSVAEVQLFLMHDVLYTKTLVMQSWHGIAIRVVSVLATAAALLLFHYSSLGLGYSHNKGEDLHFHIGVSLFDVTVTYVVSVGAVALEVVSAARVAFSSWTWANRVGRLSYAAQRRICSSWSRTMGHHNMLRLCARSSASQSSRVARWVGVEDPWNVLAHSPPAVPIPELVQAHMNMELTQQVASSWIPDHVVNVQAREKLKRWGLYEELKWTVDESILAWHVATDVYLLCCYKDEDVVTSIPPTHAKREAVQVLSNYMLFLLAARPYMLPQATSRDAYVQMCYALKKLGTYGLSSLDYTSAEALAKSLLHLGKELNTGSLQVQLPYTGDVIGRRDPATAETAARLAAKLVAEEDGSSSSSSSLTACHKVLDLLLELWMEMLIYVSYGCSAESHAKQLSNGGELVTVVAILTKYIKGTVIHSVELTMQNYGGDTEMAWQKAAPDNP